MPEKHKQLHIRLPIRLHRILRVRAATEDKTIQELVVEILSKQLSSSLNEGDDSHTEGDFNDE